eukprot:gnl/Spiro4/27276_TR13571_c0_g1_i1.p1 gnl/Spiro4/27276_TR13571_c0_g1~~gnl/Spiro4/27276_TR13571_c0_g1_i1.p1  ORF type:complete len:265 (+),score=93.72 gnl/Spiro4/27276_TR13571_c0_g1_i1:70-795(+)
MAQQPTNERKRARSDEPSSETTINKQARLECSKLWKDEKDREKQRTIMLIETELPAMIARTQQVLTEQLHDDFVFSYENLDRILSVVATEHERFRSFVNDITTWFDLATVKVQSVSEFHADVRNTLSTGAEAARKSVSDSCHAITDQLWRKRQDFVKHLKADFLLRDPNEHSPQNGLAECGMTASCSHRLLLKARDRDMLILMRDFFRVLRRECLIVLADFDKNRAAVEHEESESHAPHHF